MNYNHLVRYFMAKIKEDNIGAYAAQAALFIIMSTVPFLLVFLSLIRYTPVTESMILAGIEIILPGYITPELTSIVDEVYNSAGTVLPLALIVAVYSSAKAIQSLRYGLNIVYHIDETRNWFALRLRAMGETLALILSLLLSMVLIVFGQKIQDMLEEYVPFVAVVTEGILKLRLVIVFFFLIAFFTFIYKMLPNRKATFRSQLVGAFGCSVAWYVFSFGVSIYVDYFNGFSLYGSLTTIVFLMFWLYFAMYIFLFCGEINSAMEIILKEFKRARQKRMEKRRAERRARREGLEE